MLIDRLFLDYVIFGNIITSEYISPFSEEYFFAYLNWTPTLDAQGYFQLATQLNPLAAQHMESNTLTPTGETYSQLAHRTTSALDFAISSLTATLVIAFTTVMFSRLEDQPNSSG